MGLVEHHPLIWRNGLTVAMVTIVELQKQHEWEVLQPSAPDTIFS